MIVLPTISPFINQSLGELVLLSLVVEFNYFYINLGSSGLAALPIQTTQSF